MRRSRINKLWKIVINVRFLCWSLYSVFLFNYMVVSSVLFNWLIPWRWVEAIVWLVCYVIVLFKSVIKYDDFLNKNGI